MTWIANLDSSASGHSRGNSYQNRGWIHPTVAGWFVACLLLASSSQLLAAENATEASQTTADEEEVVDLATVLSETVADASYGAQPDRCLSSHRYRRFEIISDQHILLKGSRGRAWVSELPRRCRGLDKHSVIITEQRSNQICANDMFRAVDRVDLGGPPIVEAVCVFGKFQPIEPEQVALIKEALAAKARTRTVRSSSQG